jgi:hypothetical protein
MRPTFKAPDAIEPAVRMLAEFIDARIQGGATYEDGHLIQCSWSWFKIEEKNAERTVLAPQTGCMPMRFEEDCSAALNLVLTQRYICDSFELPINPCNARQTALLVKDLENCRTVFMNRLGPEDGLSSGWYFSSPDTQLDPNDPDSMELASLWELTCRFPVSADFFLLPTNWQVVFESSPVVLQDYSPVRAKSGSYYAEKYG